MDCRAEKNQQRARDLRNVLGNDYEASLDLMGKRVLMVGGADWTPIPTTG
jgi:hypothetical protein